MGERGQAGSHRLDRTRGRRPPAPQPSDRTQRTSRRGRVLMLPRTKCRLSGPQHVRCQDPLVRSDAAHTGREGDRATAGDDFLDRLVLNKPIAGREPPLHIDAASGKPDRDRIGLCMRSRIEPVRHRQYLLRRTLQQGREPTGRLGLLVRLDDITARRRIYRWTPTSRGSTCHLHHLLLLLFAPKIDSLLIRVLVRCHRLRRRRDWGNVPSEQRDTEGDLPDHGGSPDLLAAGRSVLPLLHAGYSFGYIIMAGRTLCNSTIADSN